jgi:predicted ATP-grasp superfamily ATP-dependent carboligase
VRVLVTDSDNRSALATVRALGRGGHVVIVAGERHPSLASVSRYCAAFEQYPSPNRDPEGFVNAIASICVKQNIDVVLPMTEVSTLLLTSHQDRLPAHAKLPFPSATAVAAAADKAQVLTLAAQLGIPTPAMRVCGTKAEVHTAASQLGFPVVIKASRSRVWSEGRWISTSVKYATDAAVLDSHLEAIPAAVYPLLVQERIDGAGSGVFICCDETGVVASFAHRRIREKPPSGGVSVLSESAVPDAEVLQSATRLLEALKWRGVAMVEFKRDSRDGKLKLMEINGRFWGSLQLAIDAGVDFPALLVEIAQGRRPATPQYRVGVRTRWLLGDVDSLLAVLMRSRARANLPESHPGRLRTLLAFFTPNRHTRFELERRDDLAPARLEARRWLLGTR